LIVAAAPACWRRRTAPYPTLNTILRPGHLVAAYVALVGFTSAAANAAA
jgi:hypothetical protein